MSETESQTSKSPSGKKYSGAKRIVSLAQTILLYAFLIILVTTGLSLKAESFVSGFFSGKYAILLGYLFIIAAAESLLGSPLSFYSDYILEHRFGLSNQTVATYFTEKLKGLLLTAVIGIPLAVAFYYILCGFGANWWLVLGIFLLAFSILIGRVAPTLIMPLFYKFKSLDDESLKESILSLCSKADVNVNGVFSFDMSRNTKKVNAAFTGIGKSRRIIIGDTLLSGFTGREIEAVFAHELGHYKLRHIVKMVAASSVMTFAVLFASARLYESTVNYFGFSDITQIAALPLLFMYLSLFGLVTLPVTNMISRKFEREADAFSLQTTRDRESYISAMEKLADTNLADRDPNKLIEFLFHSHPSIEKRIRFAREFAF